MLCVLFMFLTAPYQVGPCSTVETQEVTQESHSSFASQSTLEQAILNGRRRQDKKAELLMPAKKLQCYACCVRTEHDRGACHQNSWELGPTATVVLASPTQRRLCRHTDYNVLLLESLKEQVCTAQGHSGQARIKCKG